ncbi:UDP-N-acetylmuramoyl-L-alanine--D-glutamate ligase [Ectobacillus antri]|uniref:UDP-N-acetylmuramoylalanine--D-glutamate ligase n=1 Tax=Ectobacillus antri TaxID=2486280 RepID=A0ABT6H190_9BACI|nr:UDP-N-acetylmuramoyl-L-alanine--D-glutamate ligase [Ectobacillus antri]MDG4655834.1 UDP-N-acetylmuramoyl-L-alanine--D-glutamate ligase [Ectobacillus antri]MDG5752509.1 UDP-N-acetylmuramoyl-L-alanine--D-glutamate ligase [Ectobacillus antri]
MKKISGYNGKNVLVLGIAKSGYAAATLLHKLGAHVTVNDYKPFEENPMAQELNRLGMEVVCGHHPLSLLDGTDLIVKNPGIPYTNVLLQAALQKDIPIITEVELAYEISEAPFIAITGSNGKTTTTTLIFEMLREGQKKPIIAGNIGTVACEVTQEAKPDEHVVIELSSFQLMGTRVFRPKIALFLNLFEAHLDYHGTKEEYGRAKANIFKNQNETDYSVINAEDPEVMKLAASTKGKKIYFSTKQSLPDGACIQDGQLIFRGEPIMFIQDIALPGEHNLENILAAVSAAKLAGVSNPAIQQVLKTFTGVKHRLQYVATVNNRKFYNDSKATNILATQKALSAFVQPVVLLAGGLDRGNEFDELVPYLQHTKAMVLFGQTAEKLAKAAYTAGIKAVKVVNNLEQAVQEAYRLSEEGDVVLLSPACASWDQFKTFEDRGDMFIQAVHKLV